MGKSLSTGIGTKDITERIFYLMRILNLTTAQELWNRIRKRQDDDVTTSTTGSIGLFSIYVVIVETPSGDGNKIKSRSMTSLFFNLFLKYVLLPFKQI